MLQEELYTETLGDATERCAREAFIWWHADGKSGLCREEAYATLVSNLSVTLKTFNGGRLDITVHINCRQVQHSEAYYFLYQRESANAYRRRNYTRP